MSVPPTSTVTPREQAVAAFFQQPRIADASMAIIAALIGLAAHGLAKGYCGSPSDSNEALNFCAQISHGLTWVAYLGGAVALACTVRVIARRTSFSRRLALGAVTVVAIAATAWVYAFPAGP